MNETESLDKGVYHVGDYFYTGSLRVLSYFYCKSERQMYVMLVDVNTGQSGIKVKVADIKNITRDELIEVSNDEWLTIPCSVNIRYTLPGNYGPQKVTCSEAKQ